MVIFHTTAQLRAYLSKHSSGKSALVPTMGNLHAGHLALVTLAKKHSEQVIATIFVNRLQFLPHEDFDSYPRTADADVKALSQAGCDVLFAPSEQDLYPEPQTFKVQPDPLLANQLEGEFRPGFFTGVCTVVMKLFQITRPDVAVFGAKDYQQWRVIEAMVRQFALPIEIIRGTTQRAEDGLALSSRNRYLSQEERARAIALVQTLQTMVKAAQQPKADIQAIEAAALQTMRDRGWQPDYMSLRTQANLSPINTSQREPWLALGAARLGGTRLIDNLEF